MRLGPCAPRYGISSASDQCSRPRQSIHSRSEPAPRNAPFALLKRLPASGPPFQGQSSWPIPSAQRSDSTGPVRSLHSSTPSRLAPDDANSPRATRCPVPSERPRLFFNSPLPLGAFIPLPIKAFKLITSREAHRIGTPDFLRSPLPAVFRRPAADQRSRLVTSRSAYCLTNLLEPSSLCT